MNKEILIPDVVSNEWEMFTNTNNIGRRSSCQDQKGNFIASRAAYWNIFDEQVLSSYLNDLSNAKDPDYIKTIKHLLGPVTDKKLNLVDSIMLIYMKWEESLISSSLDIKNRVLYKQYDSKDNTSVETYMSGELTSYSEETLSLILAQFLKNVSDGENPVKNYLLTLKNYEEGSSVETYMRGELTSYSEETLSLILAQFLKNVSDGENPVKNYLLTLKNYEEGSKSRSCSKNSTCSVENSNSRDKLCNDNCKNTRNGFNSNLAAHYSTGDCNRKNTSTCNVESSKSASLKRIFSLTSLETYIIGELTSYSE